MYTILVSSHSGLRWIALLMLVFALINAASGIGKKSYVKKDKLINLFAMIVLHLQLMLGLVLYFWNEHRKINFSPDPLTGESWMANPLYRFFGMEHIGGMLLAIILITIGRKKAEKQLDATKKHRTILLWYSIGLVIILAMIPWPFRTQLGVTSWF